jgi:hypothetical protein
LGLRYLPLRCDKHLKLFKDVSIKFKEKQIDQGISVCKNTHFNKIRALLAATKKGDGPMRQMG